MRADSSCQDWPWLGGATVLTLEEELDLTGIRWHWGSAYGVGLGDGVWTAIPHVEPATVLTADSADELRALIRADYTRRTAKPAPLMGERMST
jgi:hypothetical protein